MAISAQFYPENLGFSLGGSQNLMDNVYGFNELYFKQQQQLQNPQQKTQNPSFLNSGSRNNYHQSMAFSQSIAVQVEKQRQEIDQFINLQGEKLRLALQAQRKQQITLLLRKYEAKTAELLKRKDEEIAKAMNRTMELEDFLQRMEVENQTWQRVAKENEVMVESLNNTIEQLRENACFNNGAEDAESCCNMTIGRENETGENRGHRLWQENGEHNTGKMVCKSCDSRSPCVVFLPCRHLCSCKACEAFLDSCPVCGMGKKASIEALF